VQAVQAVQAECSASAEECRGVQSSWGDWPAAERAALGRHARGVAGCGLRVAGKTSVKRRARAPAWLPGHRRRPPAAAALTLSPKSPPIQTRPHTTFACKPRWYVSAASHHLAILPSTAHHIHTPPTAFFPLQFPSTSPSRPILLLVPALVAFPVSLLAVTRAASTAY
jgi:hypothetical protein